MTVIASGTRTTACSNSIWMDYIEDSTLSAIIMRNTTISRMQADAFHIAEPGVLALIAIGLAGLRQRRRLPAA